MSVLQPVICHIVNFLLVDGSHLFTSQKTKKYFSAHPFTKMKKVGIIHRLSMKCASGSMDRASDSGSEGWGFESLLAYHDECSYRI